MPRKKGQGKSPQQLFRERMDKEGKGPAFMARWAEAATQEKKHRQAVIWQVMREFGYESAEKERELAGVVKLPVEKEEKPVQDVADVYRTDNELFEKALSHLSNDYIGVLPDDLLWIYTHPAMSRLTRQKDNKKIVLTHQDLEHKVERSNGDTVLPNAGMIQMLQHYANDPKSFFSKVLARMEKAKADQEKSDKEQIRTYDEPGDWKKIEKMIKAATNG